MPTSKPCSQRHSKKKHSGGHSSSWTSSYQPSSVWAPVFFLILFIIMIIVAIVRWMILRLEVQVLFPGSRIDYYRKLKRGRFYFLNSGGGLLHYSIGTPNDVDTRRRILFLHGQSGSLDLYANILEHLHTQGYNVFALEYYEYGLCWHRSDPLTNNKHISCILLDNMYDAWSLCGTSNTILVGFSLGGGVVGQTYNYLMPQPAQLVFINTFYDLPDLVVMKTPMGLGHWIAPLMVTQWKCEPPEPYFHSSVAIISTKDDALMPPSQAQKLYDCFKHAARSCKWRELEDGGHALSVVRHLDSVTCLNILLDSHHE
jgi:esterase/lipase